MLCLSFSFCFFKDMHYNTFCILKKMTFSAFHYLTLSVRCEELDAHINYIYFWKAHTVNTFWRNFINIWGGADFGPYSSQSFDRLIGTYTSPYWKSGISTTSVRNPRYSIRTSASTCFFCFNLKKKFAPSGGRREHFWGISCDKSLFCAKKSYFFQF